MQGQGFNAGSQLLCAYLALWASSDMEPRPHYGCSCSTNCKSRASCCLPSRCLPSWLSAGVAGEAKEGRELQAMVSALKRKAGAAAAAAAPRAGAAPGKKRKQGGARASAAVRV